MSIDHANRARNLALLIATTWHVSQDSDVGDHMEEWAPYNLAVGAENVPFRYVFQRWSSDENDLYSHETIPKGVEPDENGIPIALHDLDTGKSAPYIVTAQIGEWE